MLEARVTSAAVMEQLMAALPGETEQLTISRMLDYARAGFWRFTAADNRTELAPKLERVIRTGLDRAKTTAGKSAWFGVLRSIATTPETLAWLEQVWSHKVKVPGLPFAENDEADLALELAVRDVANADAILVEQAGRLKNPDRKAWFQFVAPAVSRSSAIREAFFEGLKDPKNRRREAWVLDAVRYLHHPLRSAESKKLIKPALDLVLEIQRTGDIFFPKRWADATLGGYQAVTTAADVRAFIDALPPDYPPRLKWVLLASADPLFRAAQLSRQ
jgi:aminopeptidase N